MDNLVIKNRVLIKILEKVLKSADIKMVVQNFGGPFLFDLEGEWDDDGCFLETKDGEEEFVHKDFKQSFVFSMQEREADLLAFMYENNDEVISLNESTNFFGGLGVNVKACSEKLLKSLQHIPYTYCQKAGIEEWLGEEVYRNATMQYVPKKDAFSLSLNHNLSEEPFLVVDSNKLEICLRAAETYLKQM